MCIVTAPQNYVGGWSQKSKSSILVPKYAKYVGFVLGRNLQGTLAILAPGPPRGPVPGLAIFRCDLVAMPALYFSHIPDPETQI